MVRMLLDYVLSIFAYYVVFVVLGSRYAYPGFEEDPVQLVFRILFGIC